MKKLSTRQMKRQGLSQALRCSYGPAEVEELLLMHAIFEHYLAHLLASASSSLQLQVRLASAELVGAEVLVVDATPRLKETIGLAGLVIGRSSSLIFLLLPAHTQTRPEDLVEGTETDGQGTKKKPAVSRPFSREWLRRQVVLKLPLREIALALPLPMLVPPQQTAARGGLTDSSRKEQQRALARYPSTVTVPALPTSSAAAAAAADGPGTALTERVRELRELLLSRQPLGSDQQQLLLREEAEEQAQLGSKQPEQDPEEEEEEVTFTIHGGQPDRDDDNNDDNDNDNDNEMDQQEQQQQQSKEEEEEPSGSADFLAFGPGDDKNDEEDEEMDVDQPDEEEEESAVLPEIFSAQPEQSTTDPSREATVFPFRSFRRVAILRGQAIPPRRFI